MINPVPAKMGLYIVHVEKGRSQEGVSINRHSLLDYMTQLH
jgi:hypothetical protein